MKEQRTKQILICLAASLGCFWLGNRAGLLYVSAAGTVTQRLSAAVNLSKIVLHPLQLSSAPIPVGCGVGAILLATYVINPLHTNLYRKSLSLRRTKTDRIDARTIAMMLMSDVDLKSYSNTVYHNEELKSLTRYRFDKVKERAKLKSSVARLVNILFPELEKLVSSLQV